ncbi:MAG: hypothetical protein U1F52_05095 [Burkholderiales bacterium]
MKMSPLLRSAAILAVAIGTLPPVHAAESGELPAATNALERIHLKNAKCVWTKEIGDYIYQCLKENFGMNAHWCHNEAMEVLCPKQLEQAQATPEGSFK